MNILPNYAWAILTPAEASYVSQPAYNIMTLGIRPTRSRAITSFVGRGVHRERNWRRWKRKGYMCRLVLITSAYGANTKV